MGACNTTCCAKENGKDDNTIVTPIQKKNSLGTNESIDEKVKGALNQQAKD